MRIIQTTKFRPRSEWAERLRIRALAEPENVDLNSVLETYRRHNEFYANRLKTVLRWDNIAPLTKDELADIPVSASEPLHETRSSGTSGLQVIIRNTLSERRFRQALAYRPFLFYPLREVIADHLQQVIFVDGVEIDAVDKQQWPFEFGGRSYLTWRVGIAAPAEKILALLIQLRPQIIRGLCSGIVRFVEQTNRPLDNLGVQVVSPSGEFLTSEWRSVLSNAFAAPVLDRYGATETGSIAWQCPYCDDYHANVDELIVEPKQDGVLVTPLFIESQPMLRYQLEDRVDLHTEEHACRIRLPKLTVLEGRRDDWIIDGAGCQISPLSFQFEQVAGLKAWRMHQLETGAIHLYVDLEAGGEVGRNTRAQMIQQFQNTVPGRGCELIDGTRKLQRSGKFKRVVSDITFPR
jgi:phenylacetate-coenzyme A ligase PaaK-like adenylate-forming protein